jgi:type 1 glutamine amidotransferase
MYAADARALVLTGAGRYADPWHRFEETTARLVEILARAGIRADVAADVDASLADLARPDLLVVNAGDPWRGGEPGAPAAAVDNLSSALDGGIGVLAVHSAISSLRDYDVWRPAVGGDWIVGTSGHPPIGTADVSIEPVAHPITAGLADFSLVDERYTGLAVDPDVVGLVSHRHAGVAHPLLWAREYGRSRIVYDALGHDTRSYDSQVHRELIRRAALWALGS